jgi:hypothetical protein
MTERLAILKGYALHIIYSDGSSGTRKFGMDGLANLETELAALFDADVFVDMVQSFTVTKIWSQPGETVPIPVKYQS